MSCDLTPCDLFLWSYLKSYIFATHVVDLNDMQQRITNKIEEINDILWFVELYTGATNEMAI